MLAASMWVAAGYVDVTAREPGKLTSNPDVGSGGSGDRSKLTRREAAGGANSCHPSLLRFGSSGDDVPLSLAVDRLGNRLMSGYFLGDTLDFGCGPLIQTGEGTPSWPS